MPHDSELALQLEAAAVIAEMNDPGNHASSYHPPRCDFAPAGHRGSGKHRLNCWQQPAFISVLTNEPAEVGAELASRRFEPETADSLSDGRQWASTTGWFSQSTFALLWSRAVRSTGDRCSMPRSRRRGRAATASGSRWAWLTAVGSHSYAAERSAAEADTRTALAATALPAPPMFRVSIGGVLAEGARRAGRA